jgi:hypothetical protein
VPSGQWQTEEDAGIGARYGAEGLPESSEATLEPSDTSKETFHPSNGSEISPEEAITIEDTSTSDDEDLPDNSPYPQVRASVSAVDDDTTLSIKYSSNVDPLFTICYPRLIYKFLLCLKITQVFISSAT